MFDTPIDKKMQEGMKTQTKIISIVIRNAMEDFHTKHLSDEQMKELNIGETISHLCFACLCCKILISSGEINCTRFNVISDKTS